MTDALGIDDKAPDFASPNEDGKIVTLSLRGKPVMPYCFYYPKDDTPNCTKKACGRSRRSSEMSRSKRHVEDVLAALSEHG